MNIDLITSNSSNILINFISIIFNNFLILLSLKFNQKIISKKICKQKIMIFIIFETFAFLLLKLLNGFYLINLIIIILSIFLFKFFCNTSLNELYIIEIFVFLIKSLCNSAVYVIWFYFYPNLSLDEFNLTFLSVTLKFLIETILWEFLYLIIEKKEFSFSNINTIESNNKNDIVKIIFNFSIIFIITLKLNFFKLKISPIYIISEQLIYEAFFIFELSYINHIIKSKQIYIENTNLKLTNENLTVLYNEVITFKHDFNNIVQTIGGLLMTNNYSNLKTYYKGLNKNCMLLNSTESITLEKINNPCIYTILASKYKQAQKDNIIMNVKVFCDLTQIDKDIFEIIRILGILLDNSIEAARECNKKLMNIEFREENNQLYITIENTYIDKNIDIKCLFLKKYSTKKGNTGLGLWKVKNIISKNKNLKLNTKKDSKIFTQELIIQNELI